MPAAALSAYGRTDDRVQALLAGFQIHVPKPVQPAELVAVVASLARRGRRRHLPPFCDRVEASQTPHMNPCRRRLAKGVVVTLLVAPPIASAHDHTLRAFEKQRRVVLAQVAQDPVDVRAEAAPAAVPMRP